MAAVVKQALAISAHGRLAMFILLANIGLSGCVAGGMIGNQTLLMHSYFLFGFQLVSLTGIVLARTRWLYDCFLPSTFTLIYFCINLTLGSYLVPRGYGWNKEFTEAVAWIDDYPLIVGYLLMCNTVLAALSLRALARLDRAPHGRHHKADDAPFDQKFFVLRTGLFVGLFGAVSVADIDGAFSLQLGLLIVHLADPSLRSRRLRLLIYALYLSLMTVFSFENKREIAMALFFMILCEAYFTNSRLRFTPVKLSLYAAMFAVFMTIVISASVLRGYGDFVAASPVDLVRTIPSYIGSDIFIDGITDNLELNYNYGVTVTSISLALRGIIDYQLGSSIIKPLFLPFPRELVSWKPESVLQIFTQAYAPDWWSEGGSMPVSLAAEMFVNFYVFGALALGLILWVLNELFIRHTPSSSELWGYSTAFMSVTVLMFIRGSGLEQYLYYYMMSLPTFFAFSALRNTSVKNKARTDTAQ